MSTKFLSMHMFSRALLYVTLLVGAAFFLAPLYVMVVTSLKDADEIRQNSLVSLPGGMNFDAWRLAWDSACTGAQCSGLEQGRR
jgi:glucose/mannose transport system permease protein